ncbi:hypothetical protein ACHHYP_00880 [Achlya hypogyna]|uniref:Uncharacterized protein n=1 Tax=Achlya hypogyna TaxID=1202772 RepID=A0A1V9ZA76_ACHHY|nr:hypothetical protein ACHHYP_00880 [Achlya hypogyna]
MLFVEDVEERWPTPVNDVVDTPESLREVLANAIDNGLGDIGFAWYEDMGRRADLLESQAPLQETSSPSPLECSQQSEAVEIFSIWTPLSSPTNEGVAEADSYPLEITRDIYTSRVSNSKLVVPRFLDEAVADTRLVDGPHRQRSLLAIPSQDEALSLSLRNDEAIRDMELIPIDNMLAVWNVAATTSPSPDMLTYHKAMLDCDQLHLSTHVPSLMDHTLLALLSSDLDDWTPTNTTDTCAIKLLEVPRLPDVPKQGLEGSRASAMLHEAIAPTSIALCVAAIAIDIPFIWHNAVAALKDHLFVDANEDEAAMACEKTPVEEASVQLVRAKRAPPESDGPTPPDKRPRVAKTITYKVQDDGNDALDVMDMGLDDDANSPPSPKCSQEQLRSSFTTFVAHAARPVIWKLASSGQLRYQETATKSALEHLSLATLESSIRQHQTQLIKLGPLTAQRTSELTQRCAVFGDLVYLHTLRLLLILLEEHGSGGGITFLEVCLAGETYQKALPPAHFNALRSMLCLVAPEPTPLHVVTPEKRAVSANHSKTIICAEEFPYRDTLVASGVRLIPRTLESPLGLVLDETTGLCVCPLTVFLEDALTRQFAYQLALQQELFSKIWVVLEMHTKLTTTEQQAVEAHIQAATAATVHFRATIVILTSLCPDDTLHFIGLALQAVRTLPFEDSFELDEDESAFEKFVVSTRAFNPFGAQRLMHYHSMETILNQEDGGDLSLPASLQRQWRLLLEHAFSILNQDHGIGITNDGGSSSDEA